MADMVEDEASTVLLDVGVDGVATLTLNRPQRNNAWNPVLERRFYQLLAEADRDDRVRAVVLTGAGRSFCPGVDSRRLDGIAGAPMDLSGRTSPVVTHAFRKPLIAAINGACAGLGLVQALMCDVRFAARGAKFATSFSRRGLAGEYGMTWLLPRMIGVERAMDLLLSGRAFDADEALTLGLVSRVTEREEVVAAATAYARDLAANCSPTSMAMIKHQVLTDLDATFEQAMRHAYRAMAALATGSDFREGMDSFLHKRAPRFPPLSGDLDPAEVTGARMAALDVDPTNP
ncbi:enoyl-CoA hydratase-related protein [Actinomadura sp. SCN-SB]|uniref:enoyl-CoA hydratase-related protein n=1 Tax=Actinomadura sp. SCN-SB TaxID=3373092 RepID=UPI0037524384